MASSAGFQSFEVGPKSWVFDFSTGSWTLLLDFALSAKYWTTLFGSGVFVGSAVESWTLLLLGLGTIVLDLCL